MKISLLPNNSFWGLMNPTDLSVTLTLSDESPVSPEINQEKLLPWEVTQIVASVKAKKISISVQLEDLVKSTPVENKVEKKTTRKKTPLKA